MRNLYFKSKSKLGYFVLLAALLLGFSHAAEAQVRVNFTQRSSQYTPTKKIYNIKGDFTMIGNSNMTLQNYSENGSNSSSQMVYIDVDGDSNTLNSSSATLGFSTENGAIPSCSNIIFAGLYWTGRSSNDGSSPNTFTVTKNNVTKNYDKKVVSLKGPLSSGYTTITANAADIYYPTSADGFMYSAYAEVTDYVRTNGIGNYTLADMALKEGDGGSTGFYGGWSLVVVYENPKMKYRDVTIFDGHAYVAGNVTANFEIPVSGFHTVQGGPVNMKLGLLAGEGDRNISGDYFQVRNATDTNWVTLNHTGNASDNFFNSSILTGGNVRNPNLLNNTGLDISMFSIPNVNNSVITNNQTSTRFRYGTTQDTYVIFGVIMAVDAYIPDIEGNISTETVNGVPATNPVQNVLPGQILEYKLELKNKGTEAINNTKIIIPVPYNTTYVPNSAIRNVYFTPLPTPNSLTFEPTMGSNGSIVWDFGTLPLPVDPETVLADLIFKFQVTEDCTLLKNVNCNNVVAVNGQMSGSGAVTGIVFNNKSLIQGFTIAGICQGNAISAPILVNIDATDYINTHCQGTPPVSSFVFCSPGPNIPITSINGSFPAGSLFYNQFPVTGTAIQYTINNPFPSTAGTATYYAIPPNSVPGCYFQFTITVTTITSQPTATDIQYCVGATASPLTATPSNPNYTLYYFATPTSSAQLSITPSTTTAGQTTYYVAEGQSSTCIGPKKPIVVTVFPAVTINAPAAATIQGCATSAITGLAYSTTPVTITLAQYTTAGGTIPNSASIGTYTLSYTDTKSGTCPIIVTRTFSIVSICGTKTAVQTITIQDSVAPVISALPATATISCPATPQFATATATDNCGANVTLTFADVNTPGSCTGSYSVTRTWTATDACGNASTASQTINVNDTVAPVISALPVASTIACPATPQFATATATDNCGANVTLTFADVNTPGSCAGSYSVTRTWTATDACGNTSTATQTINVNDTVAPVIAALPAASTIACPATPQFATATATDNCGANVTLTFADVNTPGSCAGSYSVTRTWTSTDACGNTSTASQTINVNDTVAPVISALPAASTIACPATPQFATATATDNCGANVTLTFADLNTPGSCAGSYSVTRTWTATDACGNTSTATQTINVNDTVAPVISALPAASTIACPATPQFATATATDNCGANVTLTFADVNTPGSCAGSYSVTRTWTATDACGNASTASQTINVNDTVAPVISALPVASTIACPATPQFATATATDNCGANVTLTFADVNTPGSCAGSYSVTRTWTATDACGNTSTASQTINVNDTVVPVISELPAASTIACPATPQFATATATDNCGANVTLTFADVNTPGSCAGSYSVTRTWTSTDACGNTSTASQTINVNDTVAPVISALPAASTIACPATPQFATATATDNCGANVTLAFADVNTPGSCAGSYSVTRTWTATDACGNTSTATQTINVNDTVAPVISALPAASTIACPATPQFATATATDNCGANVTLTFADVNTPGSCAGSYSVTRTWTATDACGNTSTASQTINVNDTVAPVISALPVASTIACPASPQFATASATDNCGANVTLTFADVNTAGSCAGSYSVTRTWTATDACGNTSTASQTINVNDTVAPVISELPAASTITCPATPQFTTASATDNCGANVTLTFADVNTAGSCAGSYSVTRTWTATDACGNTSTASQTINVNDTVAPVISVLPAASTIACPATPEFATASATDNCEANVTLTFADVNTPGSCAGSYSVTRTWTATDACGNTSTSSQTISVEDVTAPEITAQASNITVECDGSGNQTAINNWLNNNGGALANDACSQVTWTNNFDALSNDCSAAVTVIFTATDVCGNASTTSATFTIQDVTAPVTPQAPETANVVCAGDVPANISLTATDNCAGTITALGVDNVTPGACVNSFVITRTWTFTDACGNSSSVSQTINVIDTVAPVAPEAPASVTVACAGEVPVMVSLTANDNCNGPITVEGVDSTVQGACANSFVTTRTWTFTDACGNSSSVSQTINVIDTVAPVAPEAPASVTVACAGEVPAMVSLTANDNCNGAITVEGIDSTVQGACANSFVTTRTWTFTDACGNTSSVSQTINVIDTVAPVAPEAPASVTVACAGEVPAMVSLTANDNCNGAITVEGIDSTVQGACANSFVTTRTWTFTDACGNSSSVSQTINVIDTVAPVTPEAPASVTVACAGEAPAMISLTANDNCNGAITVEGVDSTVQGTCPNSFVTTRTWTFTDACGNTSSVSQAINVNDTVAPVISELPAASTIACPATPEFATASATDNCEANVTLTFADVNTPGSCAGSYSVTRTWTATDACGNTSTSSQTISVEDVTAPEITTQASNITVECDGSGNQNAINNWLNNNGGALANDACSQVTWTNNFDALSNDCSAAVTVIFTATDVCGNASTTSATFTIQDVTAPVTPQAPETANVVCAGDVPANISLTATDNCAGTITALGVDNVTPGACVNSFVITRTWTFTDACGNSSSVSQTINVIDTVAPVAPEAPASVTVACAGEVPVMVSLTANDNCNGPITVEGVDSTVQGACANSFVTTRTWTFTDACGNSSSVSQTINVIDTVAPVAPEAPASVTVACAGEVPAMVSLTANDNCNGAITVEGIDSTVQGACANSFVTTRTWTFTDACGNTSSVSQTINVIDTVAPVAPEAPASVTVACAGEVPAMVSLTANDNCNGAITVEGIDSTVQGACANSFVTTRTWTFTDACGNSSSVSQTINVIDTVAPVAPEAPAPVTMACSGNMPVMVSLTAVDNCNDQITVNGVDTTVQGACPNSFVTTRTWTFTDACGNTSSVSQTITLEDTIPPAIPAKVPVDTSVSCIADVPTTISLTAIDNCGEQITADGVDAIAAGSCPNSFVITRTWTFTDACGNTSSTVQVITVNDNVAPTFNETIPANVSVSCGDIPAAATLTATDNCVGNVAVVMTESTVNGACAGSYALTRTWTATDACGNIATASQVITVSDASAPTFDQSAPGDITVSCDAVPTAPTFTATDNCGTATVAYAETRVDGACTGSYVLTRTWTASDVCGNATSQSQIITVSDVTAPSVNETFDAVVNTTCANIPAIPVLTFTDNCSGVGTPTFTENIINQSLTGYTLVREWTVTDGCGNLNVFTQNVNVTYPLPVQVTGYAQCNDPIQAVAIDLNTLLPAGTSTSGLWTNINAPGGLSDTMFNPANIPAGFYILQYVINNGGCNTTVNVNMQVAEDCGDIGGCDLPVVHNAFTPNGDGLNEYFSIEHLQEFVCYPTNKVEIFNRWGILVYETQQYDNALRSFKGVSEGRTTVAKSSELPTGTYFYVLEYTTQEGQTVKKDGYLYLSR